MVRIKRRWWVSAAVAVALAAAVFIALPANPEVAPAPQWRLSSPTVRGVFHIHTLRSDGGGSVDDVAEAAARAGLKFVILADHGDGTRRPDPPVYRYGVLCIDAVEISTTGGHYAALGLGQAPYPLAGDPRDVVDDVRRLGGFGIVTHPLSPKQGLAWGDWQAPFDAIEWLNGDSVWRDAPRSRLVRSAATYALRPVGSLAGLYDRPAALDRAASVERRRHVVLMAGADVHSRLGFRKGAGGFRESLFVRVPSYEAAFEVATLGVELSKPLGGNAALDADTIVAAIRAGHLHTVVDGLATPGAFEFAAASGGVSVIEGDSLPLGDAVTVRARANVPPGGRVVLFLDGKEIAGSTGDALVYAGNRPGSYRAEVWLDTPQGGRARPWIVSNPIEVSERPTAPLAPPIEAGAAESPQSVDRSSWSVEHDAVSSAAIAKGGQSVILRYTLAGDGSSAPYAALVSTGTVGPGATDLQFTGQADRPMRIAVQLRAGSGGEVRRWLRSVYLDETPREVTVSFADMRPIPPGAAGHPSGDDIKAVLFTVDTTNTRPGSSGLVTIERVRVFGKRQDTRPTSRRRGPEGLRYPERDLR